MFARRVQSLPCQLLPRLAQNAANLDPFSRCSSRSIPGTPPHAKECMRAGERASGANAIMAVSPAAADFRERTDGRRTRDCCVCYSQLAACNRGLAKIRRKPSASVSFSFSVRAGDAAPMAAEPLLLPAAAATMPPPEFADSPPPRKLRPPFSANATHHPSGVELFVLVLSCSATLFLV